jgi:hypothetical protein
MTAPPGIFLPVLGRTSRLQLMCVERLQWCRVGFWCAPPPPVALSPPFGKSALVCPADADAVTAPTPSLPSALTAFSQQVAACQLQVAVALQALSDAGRHVVAEEARVKRDYAALMDQLVAQAEQCGVRLPYEIRFHLWWRRVGVRVRPVSRRGALTGWTGVLCVGNRGCRL